MRKAYLGATDKLNASPGSVNREQLLDPSDFKQIVGDYSETLRACEALLRTNESFGRQRTFVYNVAWFVKVEPRICRLKEQIQFHNIKVGLIFCSRPSLMKQVRFKVCWHHWNCKAFRQIFYYNTYDIGNSISSFVIY